MEKIVMGGLLGATVGFLIGWAGSRAGGSCPLMCNPYIACVLFAAVGAAVASGIGPAASSFTVSEHLVTVGSRDEFDRLVLKVEGLALAEFETRGCRFCRKLEPVLHALADRYAARIRVLKVPVRNVPGAQEEYDLKGYPTLVLFRAGQEVDRVLGYKDEGELSGWLDSHNLPSATPQE